MKSFKTYLSEQMKIDDLKFKLENGGYPIKKVSGKTIDVISDSDRVGALNDIAKKFKGKYNPKGGSSSIGRVELPGGFFVQVKGKGGGSGAGSDVTKLAESAQCAYCAAAWYGKDFSGKTIKASSKYFDVDERVENIINKLPDHWIQSCMLTAERLKKEFKTKKYVFHRGSSWVNKLENHWKNLNKVEKQFSNLNKWSPADIYMVSAAGSRIDFTKANSLLELNSMMLDAIQSKDVIGISLKQVKGTAKLEYKNVSKDKYLYEFKSLTVGKRGFFASGDAYIMYGGGQIQFRRFGTTWQGEIKGKTANMGKISGGPINAILKRNGVNLKAQNEIVDKTPALVEEFYKWYKHFEKGNAVSKEEFNSLVEEKDQNWWISKYLSVQLMFHLDKKNHIGKNEIVSEMIGYAASESEMSGPYVKVS